MSSIDDRLEEIRDTQLKQAEDIGEIKHRLFKLESPASRGAAAGGGAATVVLLLVEALKAFLK